MQLDWRRAIVTLLWAGSIIAAGPAIAYAQMVSERAAQADAQVESTIGSDDVGFWVATPPEPAVNQLDDAH